MSDQWVQEVAKEITQTVMDTLSEAGCDTDACPAKCEGCYRDWETYIENTIMNHKVKA